MLILAFESSCDETSAAVVECSSEGFRIKSNIIASQVETHRLYGGVVPEIASRAHIEAISSITYEALKVAEVGMYDIDAVAVKKQIKLQEFDTSYNYAMLIQTFDQLHVFG